MKSKYYITNDIAVHYNFRVVLAQTSGARNDDNTFLMAAPIVDGLPDCGIAIYLSTNGDPELIATWSGEGNNSSNLWSIWDEMSAEDSTEEHPNIAGYMKGSYGIEGTSDIESLMVAKELFD